MFGLFQSRPPLSTFARVDIELLLRRCVEVIGADVVVSAEVITDIKQLDLNADSPANLIASAAEQVSRCLQVDIRDIQFLHDDDPEFAFASTYANGTIRLHREVTTDPLRTVVEIANQLAHHFWVHQPAPRPLDTHARTTTLMPIAMGLGVLASKASLQESHWNAAGYSGWSMSRCGYYSALEIGYALALMARLRGESSPAWLSSLRLDTKKTFQAAQKYFSKHESAGGELLFDASRIPSSDRDATELSNWLAGSDSTFAMAAAYALAKFDQIPSVAADAALALTRSKDSELVVLATRLLGKTSNEDSRINPQILTLVAQRINPIALAALHSASQRGMPMLALKPQIEKLLSDPSLDLIPVVDLIRKHARELSSLSAAVCQQTAAAIRFKDDEATATLLECLSQMVDDPVCEVERHIRNADTRALAIERLQAGKASKIGD
ncbi:hypothetical protein [Rubripirellula reticaptiva]|uniref:Uncharacterized protein n=1 Tax=Rubripirellula reticaptiva TaxID=2528013 RepID=A0A5C6ESN6_9BACT|nr:hypothetical protein [Rubripirellula reticaptiva]TWU51665.1 hypothetical protein Poly59_32590 [Rubripirellula reticaptiva]